MIKVFGLGTCDTCRKAMRALRDAGHEAKLCDVRKEPVDPENMATWLAVFGDALVNRKSTTWRGLDATERESDARALLNRYPALMKRPVIVSGERVLLGWTAETRAALGLA